MMFCNSILKPQKKNVSPTVNDANKERKHLVLAKIDLNKGGRRLNDRNSVQMNTFIDRRVNTESFLQTLEEKY